MQERFGGLIRWVYDETKDMQPLAVVIGNEFDVHLAQDQKKWGEFKNLYFSSYDLIHSLRGWEGVPVAIEPTFANLVGPNRQVLQDMNRKSDIIGVSYYPLKEGQVEPLLAIKRDMDMLITLYPNKRIDFYQYGYLRADSTWLTKKSAKVPTGKS
jgi:arabinogalactan endo-1,4-beta-galactosidase